MLCACSAPRNWNELWYDRSLSINNASVKSLVNGKKLKLICFVLDSGHILDKVWVLLKNLSFIHNLLFTSAQNMCKKAFAILFVCPITSSTFKNYPVVFFFYFTLSLFFNAKLICFAPDFGRILEIIQVLLKALSCIYNLLIFVYKIKIKTRKSFCYLKPCGP